MVFNACYKQGGNGEYDCQQEWVEEEKVKPLLYGNAKQVCAHADAHAKEQ